MLCLRAVIWDSGFQQNNSFLNSQESSEGRPLEKEAGS